MKKFLTVLLLTVLCATAWSTAFAATADYATTLSFLTMMDEAEMKYTNYGLDSENDEHVSMKISDANTSYTIHFFFESDLEHHYKKIKNFFKSSFLFDYIYWCSNISHII